MKTKAKVPYGDFIGTSAADNSDVYGDKKPLDNYLAKHGVNPNRYEAIGAGFSTFYNSSFYTSIICIDKDQSTETNKYIVKIKTEMSKNEFFDLFKEFSVVITKNLHNYHNIEINDNVSIEDLKATNQQTPLT